MCTEWKGLNPENDNFTSISIRGKAVVDYIASHDAINKCLEFNVYTPSELVALVSHEAINLNDEHSRLIDHSNAQCICNFNELAYVRLYLVHVYPSSKYAKKLPQ